MSENTGMYTENKVLRYADGDDIIAVCEKKIKKMNIGLNMAEKEKRKIENEVRSSVENEWTAKKSEALSNEKKRQLVYEDRIALREDYISFSEISNELTSDITDTRIEMDNERRAYNLLVAGLNSKGRI